MIYQKLDEQTLQAVLDILETMGEALAHLQIREDAALRQAVQNGRLEVTAALEKSVPLEQRIHVSQLTDEDWLRTAYFLLSELSNPFCPRNFVDREFLTLLEYVWSHSEKELVDTMKSSMARLKRISQDGYRNFVRYFARFPLWGTLDPVRKDFTTLELRAAVLKQHSYDFLWLYCRLEDYFSRRTLLAILKNWALLDLVDLQTVKSIFPDYWELDIFPDNKDDFFVDVGAYNGDSIEKYAAAYGTGYRKIYAYEISPDTCQQFLQRITTLGLHDVTLRQKGLGRVQSEMFLNSNTADSSANQLSQNENGQTRVMVVPLDEDLEDEITFLKMDIEGAEQDALLGSERIIRSLHPKLAICTYHGYEDIDRKSVV